MKHEKLIYQEKNKDKIKTWKIQSNIQHEQSKETILILTTLYQASLRMRQIDHFSNQFKNKSN